MALFIQRPVMKAVSFFPSVREASPTPARTMRSNTLKRSASTPSTDVQGERSLGIEPLAMAETDRVWLRGLTSHNCLPI